MSVAKAMFDLHLLTSHRNMALVTQKTNCVRSMAEKTDNVVQKGRKGASRPVTLARTPRLLPRVAFLAQAISERQASGDREVNAANHPTHAVCHRDGDVCVAKAPNTKKAGFVGW